MNKITPHIHSTEEIITVPQIVEGIGEALMMPIVSDYGPLTPQLVNNRRLLELYTDGAIKRSDDISLKTASILSKATTLMVCRVVSKPILSGIAIHASKIDKVWYKNGKLFSDNQANQAYTEDYSFAIISNYLYPEDSLKVEITKRYDSNNFGELKISTKKGESKLKELDRFTFSLDIDSVDPFGSSRYVEGISDKYPNEFKVIVNDNSAKSIDTGASELFGSSDGSGTRPVTYSKLTGLVENGESEIIKTYDKLAKYRRDIKLRFIYDGGMTSKNILTTLESTARKRKALGIFSCPTNRLGFDGILKFYKEDVASCRQLNENLSSYLYSCAPNKYDTILGFKEIIPSSVYYMIKVYSNMASNYEFSPAAGRQFGNISGFGLTTDLEYSTDYDDISKPDNEAPQTEQLQRVSCNPIVYNETLGTSMLINNLTFQTPNSNQLSEENNRRLFNSIQFDLGVELENYLFKANNKPTREELNDMLENYRNNVLDGYNYGLNRDNENRGFRWDIKPFNPTKRNTLELVVEVCFADSIKYIEVLYRNIPIM